MVTKASDEHYQVVQYNADSFEQTFCFDMKGEYVKANEVCQNSFGKMYCCPYLIDGVFNIVVFNKEQVVCQLNINQAIGLDNHARPNDNFPYPMIDASFIHSNIIFVSLYHNRSQQLYTFQYSFMTKKILRDPSRKKISSESSQRNFPLKSVFDSLRNMMYIFFRQGQMLRVNLEDVQN